MHTRKGRLLTYPAYESRKYCSVFCRDIGLHGPDHGESAEQRLRRLTDRSAGPDGCWIIQSNHQEGPLRYGRFKCGNRTYRAHRLAYELAYGAISAGLEVRHKCDNGACNNPAHLEVGTRQQNADDRRMRGRATQPKGVHSKIARLKESQVRYIQRARAQGLATNAQLMALFGVSSTTINRAAYGYGAYIGLRPSEVPQA